MFPIMNKRSRQGVSIPDLAGGINLRDSLTTVQDNQLTDAVNMWFRDGALRTRPGIENKYTEEAASNFQYISTRNHGTLLGEGELITVLGTMFDNVDNTYTPYNGIICFFNVYENETVSLPTINLKFGIDKKETVNYFVFRHDNKLYCFVRVEGGAEEYEILKKIYVYNLEEMPENWSANVEPYIPLVMTGGTTYNKETFENNFGQPFEGYNILSPYYRMKVYPVDSRRSGVQAMIYSLPFDASPDEESGISKFSGKKISLKLPYTAEKYVEHWAIYDEKGEANELTPLRYPKWKGDVNIGEKDMSQDGMYLMAKGSRVWLFSDGVSNPKLDESTGYPAVDISNVAKLSDSSWTLDNVMMEITAPCDPAKSEKVFDMTECTWFGGASAGINGGTRLFLGGNTSKGEESLVLYSGLNEPLYFSENCYMYVGDKQGGVTGFGKQSDMLVVFKESETYFTKYTRNDSITAEQLINQSVVDYSANSVFFPLTLIHSGIGCDLPESIQLCRNRLVWATKSGKIYTLVSNDQYSERNIYEVGEMIKRRLSQALASEDLCVSSVDWNGYYVLLCNREVYLMDYNSSGYQYAYSYQKNEDANLRIPWCYWRLGDIADSAVLLTVGGTMAILKARGNEVKVYRFKEGADDNGTPIHSSLTTKLFDFGAAGYRKNVDTVQLMLGNNGGAPISVGFVTDCGTEYDEISLDGDDRDSYSAGHISAPTLSPCIRSVLRFGVKLESDGPLIVDGMTLGYRILGGAR